MKITEHFHEDEFYVSASHPELVGPAPVKLQPSIAKMAFTVLQPLRNIYGPITINSGYRGKRLNKAVGGSKTSQHMRAEAADITCSNVGKLYEDLRSLRVKVPVGQVIFYMKQDFIHIALPSEKYPQPTFFVR